MIIQCVCQWITSGSNKLLQTLRVQHIFVFAGNNVPLWQEWSFSVSVSESSELETSGSYKLLQTLKVQHIFVSAGNYMFHSGKNEEWSFSVSFRESLVI